MTTQGFRTILFAVFIAIFTVTAAITLLGVVEGGPLTIKDGYLRTLFAALVVELIAVVIALFRSANFFGSPEAVKESSESLPYLSQRIGAIEGRWTGTANQELGPDGHPFVAEAILTLGASNPRVTGTGVFRFRLSDGQLVEHRFELAGGFLYDRFLRFEYNNVDKQRIQFGSIVLELEPNSAELRGRYTGYGVESRKIIYGSLRLAKVN